MTKLDYLALAYVISALLFGCATPRRMDTHPALDCVTQPEACVRPPRERATPPVTVPNRGQTPRTFPVDGR